MTRLPHGARSDVEQSRSVEPGIRSRPNSDPGLATQCMLLDASAKIKSKRSVEAKTERWSQIRISKQESLTVSNKPDSKSRENLEAQNWKSDLSQRGRSQTTDGESSVGPRLLQTRRKHRNTQIAFQPLHQAQISHRSVSSAFLVMPIPTTTVKLVTTPFNRLKYWTMSRSNKKCIPRHQPLKLLTRRMLWNMRPKSSSSWHDVESDSIGTRCPTHTLTGISINLCSHIKRFSASAQRYFGNDL